MKNHIGDTSPKTRLDKHARRALREAAAGRYTRAQRALCESNIRDYAAGIDYETPEWLPLNDEVADAARDVSRWRRALIDRRIIRELDYWNRTGQ